MHCLTRIWETKATRICEQLIVDYSSQTFELIQENFSESHRALVFSFTLIQTAQWQTISIVNPMVDIVD